MFAPKPSNWFRIQESFSPDTAFVKQRLSPFAKRATQPTINRYCKTHLGALDEFWGNVLIKNFPQNPFALTCVKSERLRQRPREFNNAVVKQGDAGFQAYGHAGTIKLCKNVIRKIINEIG